MTETAPPIRVAIADDQELIRMGLRMVLEVQPDIEVVAEATNGREATELDPGAIDVVLMDVRMPELDGIAATERIVAAGGAPRVLVLTTFDLDEYAFAAIRAGASGFLLKDARPDDLLAAIRAVHSGDAVLAPSVTRKLMQQFAAAPGGGVQGEARSSVSPGAAPADRGGTAAAPGPAANASGAGHALDALTPREREILAAVAEGLSNDELAERFFLSPSTVKTHIGRLLHKLGARDRVHLVILAYEAGLAG
ncbi:response regulator transcription factor [Microbacterium halophytorum]|uniref:response regulator transcription factor n=1 Tax=Microbacterium halophytorum TaxID=2067568 RepID=UPI000CFE0E0D|nr:response regulator transcription factor [Microbacterium halophytorum]